ncbi:conserved exported hypothetical protein [Candidatus Sulfopaludibacter sp. SbA4]|nr:conserved exported hypothetical protein [Candidatus Sulfopaludibacter sp. SbA4]
MLGRFTQMLLGSLFLPLLSLGLAGVSPAQQLPNEPTARERTLLAESYTSERLFLWQKRLNLQDWNIAVVMSRASELKPKTLGNIHWDLEKKTATIRVLDPADYKLPFKEMLQDMEFTVVHELIHLNFAPVVSEFPRSDANRREEEHSVNHIADALLKLDRNP